MEPLSIAWSLLYFLRDFALGGVAGALAKTATAPLERVKLILQVQDANKQMLLQNSKKFDGFLDCCKRILKEQGFASFWRGNWASLVRYFPLQAINLASKDRFKKFFLQDVDKEENFWRFFGGNMASGFVTGATSISVVYPLDLARTRLGADVGGVTHEREFTGMWDCLSRIYKHDGIVGLYRGFCVAIVGSAVYRSVHFGLYDTTKGLIEIDNFFINWSISQVAMIIATMIMYPLDTVRRRLMMQSGYHKAEHMYTGTWDCIVTMWQEEGFWAFFYGASANVMRGISSALVLVVYEELQKYLQYSDLIF